MAKVWVIEHLWHDGRWEIVTGCAERRKIDVELWLWDRNLTGDKRYRIRKYIREA